MPNLIADDEDTFRLSAHLHRSNGYTAITNREEDLSDPLYTRSPFCKPEFIFAKPVRTLLVHPSDDEDNNKTEEDVDVESVARSLPPPYDQDKARGAMQECERHIMAHHASADTDNAEWEDSIPKINWSNMQTRLFNRVVRVLHCDQLARLAHESDPNEPVLRRTTVDKTARRLRQTLASVAWNVKYTQWLHNILMDHLPSAYLTSYLDALQTLKSKVPTLVERMIASVSTRALASPSHELLSIVHKKPWDPLSGGIPRHKMRKLPKDPFLVMVPSGPGAGNTSNSRTHHWMANLSALGTVVCVFSPPGRLVGKNSVANCLDHMFSCTKAKVAELHQDYGDKPVVLVGIGSGAALAMQVAMVEKVKAVVCLGFPMYTVEDSRGTPDDGLLNLQVPVLFVTGQNASTSSVEELEDLREKLNVVTSLVVVGGADDQLRLTKSKKKMEKVTQAMVDKCVLDEVGDFLGTLLSPDYVPPTRPLIVHNIEPLPPKPRPIVKPVERKRKCDIMPNIPDGSVPVPAKKGRKPKISMMQKMVQNKWANQLPIAPNDTRTSIPSSQASMIMAGSSKQVVLDKKSLQQLTIQQPTQTVTPAPAEGTITVVAASSPTLNTAGQSYIRDQNISRKQAVLLLEELQVIPSRKTEIRCPFCARLNAPGPVMRSHAEAFKGIGWRLICPRCLKKISPATNTLLRNTHQGADVICKLAYLFANQVPWSQAMLEVGNIANQSCRALYACFRGVAHKIAWHEIGQIGGLGDIVEIDVTHLFKKKGLKTKADVCFLAGFSRVTRTVFGVIVDDLSQNSILPVIQLFVDHDSHICSADLGRYRTLHQLYRGHSVVAHDTFFALSGHFRPQCLDTVFEGPVPHGPDGEPMQPWRSHTENIRTAWKWLTKLLSTSTFNNTELAKQYVGEWMYRRNVLLPLPSPRDRFLRFLADCRRALPGIGKTAMSDDIMQCSCVECT